MAQSGDDVESRDGCTRRCASIRCSHRVCLPRKAPALPSAFGTIPTDFLARARHEAERYGEDRWVFLRELVQNSRDAEATSIAFDVTIEADAFVITCRDDGIGMSSQDIDAYLLRLYASKKAPSDGEDAAARAQGKVGRFGVGFWSVLLFGPTSISLSTRTLGGQPHGFALDVTRAQLRPVALSDQPRGTTITLRRPAMASDSLSLVVKKLKKYAGAVSGLSGRPAPTLLVNGRPVREELHEKAHRDGHFGTEPVKGDGFSGTVGLGRHPIVRLYAHGLLIREASDLDELLPRRNRRTVPLPGLYPVVHVNADGLDVLMNRQAVVEDALLDRLVIACANAVWGLQRHLLDKVAPIALMPRIRLYLAQPQRLAVVIALLMALMCGAAVAGVVLALEGSKRLRFGHSDGAQHILGNERSSPSVNDNASLRRRVALDFEQDATASRQQPVRTVEQMTRSTSNVVVNDLSGADELPPWGMVYEGPPTVFFRAEVLDGFDSNRGFVRRDVVTRKALARLRKRPTPKVKVSLVIAAGQGASTLPVPFGQELIPSSVRLDEKAFVAAVDDAQIPWVNFPKSDDVRTLTYATFRKTGREQPLAVRPASVEWPASWREVLGHAKRASSTRQAATRLRTSIQKRLRYSTSPADARRFSRAFGTWFERVLESGVADCDVMNGIEVLALWEIGIPARLVVGFVGHNGSISPVLHAWTEYFDQRQRQWKFIDASPPAVVANISARAPEKREVKRTIERLKADDSAASPSASFAARDESAADEPSRDVDDIAPQEPSSAPTPPAGDITNPATWSAASLPSGLRLLLLGLALAFLLAVVVVFALAVVALRKRRKKPAEDPILDELVHHVVKARGSPDPLGLRLRPFFPTLRRGEISLARAERLSADDRLFAATTENRWAAIVRGLVLDGTSERTAALARSVAVTDLDPLMAVDDLDAPPAHPLLAEIAPFFRAAVPSARLRHAPGKKGVVEVRAKTARGERLLIFLDVDAALKATSTPSAFELATFVLDRASVFHPHRVQILTPLAHRLLGISDATSTRGAR